MPAVADVSLSALYDHDETAWLDAVADLLRAGSWDEIDPGQLAEYLTDMARRDRREVRSRLTVLLAHILKREHQSEWRCGSWRGSIIEQRQELIELASGGVLRQHAETVLADAYADAAERAAAETELPRTDFPAENPYSLQELFDYDPVLD